MKSKIRSDDASMLQLNDWLAELRQDDHPEPPADDRPEPVSDTRSEPSADDRPESVSDTRSEPSADDRPESVSDTRPEPPAGPTVRALIGDQLRLPVMWCEMGSCISRHADPAALGEGDMRVRAIDAGWRIDALGRLACPRCQQADPNFRACHPVVPWDRHAAMTRAARIVAGRGEPTAITGWHPGTGKRGH
jgi:hypothetical protein